MVSGSSVNSSRSLYRDNKRLASSAPSTESEGYASGETGCSDVPDVMEASDVIDEVSQADSSSVDHGEWGRWSDAMNGGEATREPHDGWV